MFEFMKREKKKRPIDISKFTVIPFSQPVTIYLNKVKAIETHMGKSPAEAVVELTPYSVTCLKDAMDLNRAIVRNVARRSAPVVGDLVCVMDDDPTDVYRQVIFEIVKRGKL